MHKAIDIVLLPPEEVVERSIKMSEELYAQSQDNLVLLNKDDMVPHISLLQGVIDDEDMQEVTDLIENIEQPLLQLTITALTTSAPTGKPVAKYTILQTEELEAYRNKIVELVRPFLKDSVSPDGFYDPREVDEVAVRFILTHLDKDFDPHITLGVGSVEREMDLHFTTSIIALFQVGRYGTCCKRLWETQLK